jgi:hypothetical protein
MNGQRDTSWKRSGKRAVCAVCLVGLLSASRPAAADEATAALRFMGVYLTVKLLGYQGGLRSQDADVVGEGQWKRYDLVLNRGVRYAFFAAGDQSIADLDIYIYDLDGNLLAHDDDEDDTPIAVLAPRWTGLFQVYVKNYRGGRGWYQLAVATD